MYHAGIAMRCHIESGQIIMHSIGVQYENGKEDVLLAGMLFNVCSDISPDLTKKWYKVSG